MTVTSATRRRVSASERRRLLVDAASHVFAERGYQAAGVGLIARHAGVTVPVLYDHFSSKAELYTELVEHHNRALREIWFRHAATGEPLATWLGPAVDDWFGYVEHHPFARRSLFHETTGDSAVSAAHRRIQDDSRTQVTMLLRHQAAIAGVDLGDDIGVELSWETLRATLQGLATWWHDHPEIPRARIVQAAMSSIWLGWDKILAGERWSAETATAL